MLDWPAVDGSWTKVIPPFLLDGLEPERSIRPGSRENDADRHRTLVVCERPEERIDAEPRPSAFRGRRHEAQDSLVNGEVDVGGSHIDATGVDAHPVPHGGHLHRVVAGENGGQGTLVPRREMLEDHVGHPVRRQVFRERLEGLETPRGSPDADDGKLRRLSRDPGRCRCFLQLDGYAAAGTGLRSLRRSGAVIWLFLSHGSLDATDRGLRCRAHAKQSQS